MLWGYLLTALTYFLGAGPLRAVRSQLGRAFYWGGVVVLSAFSVGFGIFGTGDGAFFMLWLGGSFFTVAVLMGLFAEFEESGLSFDLSAAFSILVLSFLSLGVGGILFSQKGPQFFGRIRGALEQSLKGANLEIPVDQLLAQMPSVVIILWMLAIYCGVLLEGRIRMGVHKPTLFRSELFQFRAPGWVVWLFIACLLPSFGEVGPKWVQDVATNILNVSVAIFFFQGLGIIHQVLIFLRVGLFWQVFLVLFLVVQLFLFVSCIGLADYWLDLRLRLIKWRQSRLETYKRREK